MKIGFIGAGRAGCSLGRYLADSAESGKSIEITGYYSLEQEDARWAADFTRSACFSALDPIINSSDTLVISTPDGVIRQVWDSLRSFELRGKTVCHLSGSLSSDVFSESGDLGVYPASIHPMFAFSDRESMYLQLHKVSFTLEGHEKAVKSWQSLFNALGNPSLCIPKEFKTRYHCAASMLSNQVLSVLESGYSLLEDCGFSREEARSFSSILVMENVSHAVERGCIEALTGPIERGDISTVKGHLDCLPPQLKELYKACGGMLINMAEQKNPGRDYSPMRQVLKS